MVVRKDKKRKKYLGSRTRGAGDTKNRRGAGSKGGKGKTGKWRHKKSKYYEEIGTKIRMVGKTAEKPINLFDLNNYIQKQINAKKLDEKNLVLDFLEDPFLLKYTKVVSKGGIDYKVALKNVDISEGAKKRILDKGGSVE